MSRRQRLAAMERPRAGGSLQAQRELREGCLGADVTQAERVQARLDVLGLRVLEREGV